MSLELYVFLNKCNMPTPAAWQASITANGFDAQLDLDFDPFTFTGFLPCQVNRQNTGFEYYFSPKTDIAPPVTYLAPIAAPYDSVVSFIWGGNFNEYAAVLIASAALACTHPSLIHLPDDDSSISSADAFAFARQQLAEIVAFQKSSS